MNRLLLRLSRRRRLQARLEVLEVAVRSSLQGTPDHPWIPGASIEPVMTALAALDRDRAAERVNRL